MNERGRPGTEATHATRIAYMYAHAYCARELNGSCHVCTCNRRQNGVGLNGNRGGGPGSCFLKVRRFHSIQISHHARKIRSSHVEIMVFGPLILALDGLY